MATIRTFIAVDASQQVKKNASRVITRLAKCANDYKWVEQENMHLTLNFLGEIDERITPDVCNAVQKIANDLEPFVVSFDGGWSVPGD